jgi:O-antigen/teichoic acid export membrane protein
LGAQVIFALIFVLLGMGPVGALLGYVLGSLVGAAAAAMAARRSLSIRINYGLGWRMFGDGIKYLPAFVAFTTADQVVRFITADSLGGEAVGSLAVAIRVASVVALAVSAFQFAWAPVALSMRPSHESGRTLGAALRWYLVIGVLATIALGAWAPVIVLLVAGQAFADAAPAVSGLAWSAALGGAIFMLMTVAGVAHRGGLVAVAAIVGALLQLATALVGVEAAGLTAIAGAAVLGRVATFFLIGFGVRDFVSAWSWPILLCIAGGSAAMALLTFAPNDAAFLTLRLVIGTFASIAVVLLGIERLGGRGPGFRRLRRVGGAG